MYTTHGHHIPGTTKDENFPEQVARCGGPSLCSQCSREAAKSGSPYPVQLSAEDFIEKIKNASEWLLAKKQFDPYMFELFVREDEEIKHYCSPNILEMSRLQHFIFFRALKGVVGS